MWDFLADMIFFSLPEKVQWGCIALTVLAIIPILAFIWLR